MNVEFSCEYCRQEMRADSRHVGRKVRCPGCARLVVVPSARAGEAEEIVDLEAVEPAKPKPAGATDQEAVRNRKRRRNGPEQQEGRGAQNAVPDTQKPPPVVQQPATKATLPAQPVLPPPVVPPPLDQAANNSLAPPEPTPALAGPAAAILLLPARAHAEDLIDMTAMVDIVFFLLIFFLVTSIQSLESVMDMPTPQASEGGVSTGRSMAELANDPNFITVRIEEDDSIWVEDTQVFSDQELILRLRTAKNEADGPRGLLVVGNADASHGSAVRVFDAGAAAGVSGISFVVQESDEGL